MDQPFLHIQLQIGEHLRGEIFGQQPEHNGSFIFGQDSNEFCNIHFILFYHGFPKSFIAVLRKKLLKIEDGLFILHGIPPFSFVKSLKIALIYYNVGWTEGLEKPEKNQRISTVRSTFIIASASSGVMERSMAFRSLGLPST